MTDVSEWARREAEAMALVESDADERNHENLCACVMPDGVCVTYGLTKPWSISHADAVETLIGAGWRKMPSRDAIIREMAEVDEQEMIDESWATIEYMYGGHADAVLALMDGDNETHTKTSSNQ
jgi:hypothetical protein